MGKRRSKTKPQTDNAPISEAVTGKIYFNPTIPTEPSTSYTENTGEEVRVLLEEDAKTIIMVEMDRWIRSVERILKQRFDEKVAILVLGDIKTAILEGK
jgi:hypothetical protein